MNQSFTDMPSIEQRTLSNRASRKARDLVDSFANEVSDNREWPNRENVANTQARLRDRIDSYEAPV